MPEKIIGGITGNPGCGKTTVSKMFSELGYNLIDADRVCHELYENNSSFCGEIIKNFGNSIVENGKINRKELAEIVFNNPEKYKRLNKITWPSIEEKIKELIGKYESPILIDAAILIEADWNKYIDFLITVDADPEKRYERMSKKGFNNEIIGKIEKCQISQKAKKQCADYVIDNNSSLENTRKQVERIDKALRGIYKF